MMSAVKVSQSNHNKIPLPATSFSTKQLCPGDHRSYTYINKIATYTLETTHTLETIHKQSHIQKIVIIVIHAQSGTVQCLHP